MAKRDRRFARKSQVSSVAVPTDINQLTDVDDLLNGGTSPESLTFSYTSGQLTGVDGATTNIDLTYNANGSLNTVDNQVNVKTFGYNGDGSLNTITVS